MYDVKNLRALSNVQLQFYITSCDSTVHHLRKLNDQLKIAMASLVRTLPLSSSAWTNISIKPHSSLQFAAKASEYSLRRGNFIHCRRDLVWLEQERRDRFNRGSWDLEIHVDDMGFIRSPYELASSY